MAKNLSIRNLPTQLEKAINAEVDRLKTTKTEVVLNALSEVFQLKKMNALKRNVRGFFGKMTVKDYKNFQKITGEFSTIEKELWK